jgi:hypothetical protein
MNFRHERRERPKTWLQSKRENLTIRVRKQYNQIMILTHSGFELVSCDSE